MSRARSLCLCALAAAGLAAPAHAQLVFSGFNTGTNLVNNGIATVPLASGSLDDGRWTRTVSGGVNFYASPNTSVSVNTNGMINFAGVTSTSFSNTALNVGTLNNFAALLWDDLDLRAATSPQAQLWESDTPDFYSLTWLNTRRFSAAGSDTGWDMQALFFKSAVNIGGFAFLPGDIAFSYANIGTVSSDATVGLRGVSATIFAPAPGGNATGQFNPAALANLPLFPTSSQFILFRAASNPAGPDYAVSVQTIPAPGAAISLGLAGLLAARRRRR